MQYQPRAVEVVSHHVFPHRTVPCPPQDFRDPRLLASRLSELQSALPGVNVPLLVAEEPHLLHVDIQGVLANCRWGRLGGERGRQAATAACRGKACML